MRFGRIVEVEMLENHIVEEVEDVVPVLKSIEEDGSEITFDMGLKWPDMEPHWKTIANFEGVYEDLQGYKVTGQWLSFKSDVITVNEQLGEFPFNIVNWKHKYDMDINISLEKGVSPESDGKEEADILEAEITIYNPPRRMRKEIRNSGMYKREDDEYKRANVGGKPFKKFININAGYYGEYGQNVPTIFSGSLKTMEYNQESNESEITLVAQSSDEIWDVPVQDDETFTNIRIDELVKELASRVNVNVGRIIKNYKREQGNEERVINIHELTLERGWTLSKCCQEIVNYANDYYNLTPELKVITHMGEINILPGDYKYHKGVVLTQETGLIDITEKEEYEEGEEEPEIKFDISSLFIPEISYNDVIKAKYDPRNDWNYYKIEDYSHSISHNTPATTDMTCKKIEDVDTMYDGDEIYKTVSLSEFVKPQYILR